MTNDVAVIGAGSWGTALSLVLADNGHKVRIWGHRASTIDEINSYHTNRSFLPGLTLPSSVRGYTSLAEAIDGVTIIVLVVPSSAMADTCRRLSEVLTRPVTLVSASKGIEPVSLLRMSQIIEKNTPDQFRNGIVVLSGPSHAEEVSLRHPTTVVAASERITLAKTVQDLFINEYFRVYTNPDVVGVELGGALKNIIAFAAGVLDGLGAGDNAKAALITRGLAEIARLGVRLGSNPLTFLGLAGVGDLVVTCTSRHSRNWQAGNLIGQGYPVNEVPSRMNMVVEGIPTTKAAFQLARQAEVEMPITEALYQVLFEGGNPREAFEDLMRRERTHEMRDLTTFYGMESFASVQQNNPTN